MTPRSLIPVGRESKLPRREPFEPFISLRREIDRVFDDLGRGFSWKTTATDLMPNTDVIESDKEIEITAELPGLQEKDVQVNVADNVLTIKGEKKAEKEEKDKNYRLVERSYGSFSRSVELPAGTNPNAIKASIGPVFYAHIRGSVLVFRLDPALCPA